MATNMNLLRAKIVERGMTQEKLAAAIGMDSSTFWRKMQTQGLSFSIGEMHKIADTLQLSDTDATQIFLA
jgi:transcriptional regulator with XRE-family HTH domain